MVIHTRLDTSLLIILEMKIGFDPPIDAQLRRYRRRLDTDARFRLSDYCYVDEWSVKAGTR